MQQHPPEFSETRFLDLVGDVYQASLEPRGWPSVLARICDEVGGVAAALSISHTHGAPGRVCAQHGLDPSAVALWEGKYGGSGPWSTAAFELPVGAVRTAADIIDPDALRETELYRDFSERWDMRDIIACKIAGDAHSLGAVRVYGRELGDFGEAARERLELLAPHLVRAASVHTRLGSLNARQRAGAAVLDRLPFAFFACDADARVLGLNEAAEMLVERGDGLRVCDGRIGAERADQRDELRALIAGAGRAPEPKAPGCSGTGSGGALAIARGEGHAPLHVLVAPIPCSNDAFALRGGEEEPVALLLTSDPEAAPATAERAVARVLGLTPTESRVTAALARGATLREYADEAGVSIGTARWTLKCVLQKTGARRQSQLVALVLRSIASLAVPDDA